MGIKKEFGSIKLVKAVRNTSDDTNYLVYKNKTEFIAVKANSAFEAIINSGIEDPFKVVHITPNSESFLSEDDLKFIQEEGILVNSEKESLQENEKDASIHENSGNGESNVKAPKN